MNILEYNVTVQVWLWNIPDTELQPSVVHGLLSSVFTAVWVTVPVPESQASVVQTFASSILIGV